MQLTTNRITQVRYIIIIINFFTYIICLNQSVCSKFNLDGVYYTVNKNYDNQNFKYKPEAENYTVNFCNSMQHYCDIKFIVVNCSLITPTCQCYQQFNVSLINPNNISSGILISYIIDINDTNPINITFECNGAGLGCPEVESSTIFSFFQDKQLGFTISLQIIGIIFMTLGIYIYRASIVLLGACSMFFALLAIEIPVIFSPGIPINIISDVLILTAICSFFAGYVFGYFPKMGIFLLGGWIGIIISLTLNNVAFYFIKSTPANLTLWIVMPVLGILFGFISIFITRAFTIFATSLIGAYFCLRGLSWYLGAFPNQFLLARQYHLGLSHTVSWKFYLYVIALIILTASSSALQNWLFQQKAKISKNSGGLDQHFEEIEDEINAERQNLAEIADFKQLFKKGKTKAPKILRKSKHDEEVEQQVSDEDEHEDKHDQKQQIDEQDQDSPQKTRGQLTKKLLVK